MQPDFLVDFLANFFVQQKSMFKSSGAKGDYFWTVKSGNNYDPTIYPKNWIKPKGFKIPSKSPLDRLIEWDLLKLYKNKIIHPFYKYKYNGKCNYTIPGKPPQKWDCSKGCYGSLFGKDCGCKNFVGIEKKCC